MDQPRKGHLPKLAPAYYRGRAFIHWTLNIEGRKTGWLDASFESAWQLALLHTCARYGLMCPVYVLMPDHIHLLLLGLNADSDQARAIEFIRQHLRARLSPAQWQHQPFDHVLDENERQRSAFATIANYILENPIRAGLVAQWQEYDHVGHSVPGYPDLELRDPGYWELFWRIYNRQVEGAPSTRSRS